MDFTLMNLTEQPDDVGMVEVLHTGCLIQELFNLPLGEAVHWRQSRKLTCLAALTASQNFLSVVLNSLFIVFTATFSEVPSCWHNRPSTTEPNSPVKQDKIYSSTVLLGLVSKSYLVTLFHQ